jgi:hypothetical protein
MPDDATELSLMAERRPKLAQMAREWLGFSNLRQVMLNQGAPDPVTIDPSGRDVERVVLALLDPSRDSQDVERAYVALIYALANHPAMAKEWANALAKPDAEEALPESALQTMLDKARNDVMARWYEFQDGMQRVGLTLCQIHVDNEFSGTGFLVADRYVLTAFHCVAPLISESGHALAGSAKRLHVVFDDIVMPGKTRSIYCTEIGADVDWLIKFSRPDDKEDSEPKPLDEICEGRLDFALIRLSEPAGNMAPKQLRSAMRKWLTLDDLAKEPAGMAQVLIAHHPGGADLRLSVGLFRDHALASRRVRYLAPAVRGSSGAPCFSSEWKPYALHNAGYPKVPINQGVPLKLIWDAIGGATAFAGPPRLDAAMPAVLPDGRPVLGRVDVARTIDAILRGGSKTTVISVTGPEGSGKRFTAELVRSFLLDRGYSAFLLDAEKFSDDTPEAFSHRLIHEIRGSVVATPQPESPDSRQRARWISRSLSEWTRAVVAEAAPGPAKRMTWIILSRCEKLRLSPETEDLLNALLDDDEDGVGVPLRFMLTGYGGDLATLAPGKLWQTNLDLVSASGALPFMQHVASALQMPEDESQLRETATQFVAFARGAGLSTIPGLVNGLVGWRDSRVAAAQAARTNEEHVA